MKSPRVVFAVAALAAIALVSFIACKSAPRGAALTPPAQFTVPAPTLRAPARIIIYGDARPRLPAEIWREDSTAGRLAVIAQLAHEKPQLIVHSGDLVSVGADPESWSLFDREMAPIRTASIPLFPAFGNHEYAGGAEKGAENFAARFPRLEGKRWYELRAGPLALLILDTNLDSLPRGMTEQQNAWYAERIAALDADPAVGAVFVVGHHPPMTNAVSHKPSTAVRSLFLEPAKHHPKVKAFVCGHAHTYEHFVEDGVHLVVSGGGGAPRMEVRQDLRGHDLFAGPPIRPFNYCLVTVEERRAVVDVMMLDEAAGTWARGDGFTVTW